VRYYQAQDTFIATMPDGTDKLVKKDDPLPETHELVKRDLAGSGTLFRPLDDGAPVAARRTARAK
jgi:hypothetical protein